MDATKLRELKLFVQQLEATPALLATPALRFFRDYLERSVPLLGSVIVSAAFCLNVITCDYYPVSQSVACAR